MNHLIPPLKTHPDPIPVNSVFVSGHRVIRSEKKPGMPWVMTIEPPAQIVTEDIEYVEDIKILER